MTWNNHDVVGDVLMTDGILNELEHETSKAHDTFFITMLLVYMMMTIDDILFVCRDIKCK